jgi:GNAT superfamily N-acetyltransferase
MKGMNILTLDYNNTHHTHLVLSFVLQSDLDYGDLDEDIRLLTWSQHQGVWAVVVNEQNIVVGIVCIVSLSDVAGNAMLWLEVLPRFRRKGYGRALVTWGQKQSQRSMIIKSVPSAVNFYRHVGVPVTM